MSLCHRLPATIVVGVLLALAGCSTAGLGSVDSLKDKNLIVIIADCLRADHVGAYGYQRDTTPNIDALAGEGLLFENAYANSTYTRESVGSMFTGVLPSTGEIRGMWAIPPEDRPTMGELFSQAGYRTGFFTTSVIVWDMKFMRGFGENDCLAKRYDESRTSQALTGRALEFLDAEAGGEPFFLYLHYLDPHGLYDPPEDAYQRFTDSPANDPVRIYGDTRPRFSSLIAENGFGPGDPRYEDMLVRYDAEIFDVDRAVGRLIDGLRERGELENTVIVVTSDHGEEFTEHGYMEHAWTLYEETIRVPLIIWAGEALKPGRFAELTSHVNLLPTLLDVMEIPHEPLDLDGEAILTAGGGIRYAPSTKPVISELLQAHRSVIRTVVSDGWKYTGASRWLEPVGRDELLAGGALQEELDSAATISDFWGPIVHEELYQLSEDPGETVNVVESRQDIRQKLRRLIDLHIERTRPAEGEDSERPRKELSEEQLEKLRSLGYIQ